MIELPLYTIGFLSSLITELFKFFPFVGKSDLGKSITALIVIALATFLTVGFSATNFFSVMLYAFLNYKMILQPISKGLSSPTQDE